MSKKTVEEKYKKLTQRDHILLRPGMYIGSTKKQMEELWVPIDGKMEKKMLEYTPGFIKIFDEVLTNATDHSFRDSTVTNIKVNFNKETGEIIVWNNGAGIPIELHNEHNIYVPELIFGHLLSGSNYDDSEQRTGAGTNGVGSKCLGLETEVLLYNGEIKLAEDIKMGDELIGDDGNKRLVLSTITGSGEMYEIIQNRGDNYIVNKDHILTLNMPDHKVIFWNTYGWSMLWWDNNKINTKFIKAINNLITCQECGIELNSRLKRHYTRIHKGVKIPINIRSLPKKPDLNNKRVINALNDMKEFSNSISNNNIFDIKLNDYLNLSITTKSRLAGVRGNCVNWESKDILLDPYILGLWLGDGMKTGYAYSCDGENDYQIIDYLNKWCINNDAILTQLPNNKYFYRFTSISNPKKRGYSQLKIILEKYNLINNKHIPKDYLINSREIRLSLLAGFIDSDGTLARDGTRIIISQSHKHEKLIRELLYLSRSLGFCCSLNSRMATYTSKGVKKESKSFYLNISGNIQDIPTLLPRKKCVTTKTRNTI